MGVADTAEAVARRSYGRLVALLAARTHDISGAEDALSEAFAAALAGWPRSGIPQAPEAWLLTVARRKLIDANRRWRAIDEPGPVLERLAGEFDDPDSDGGIPDERLRLMFACAHPAIDPGVRAPLILQTVLGFDAATIASAFLVAPSTMSQRLVRAKSRIRRAGIPFRVPERGELAGRLQAVLESIYAIYAEGWSDPAGTQARSRGLAEEGIWLGRLVASLLPQEPEALGLLALMLHAEARLEARRDAQGEYVALDAQDPALWNAALIDEAEALLLSASRMDAPGRFQLEAAVQSAHAARRYAGWTDWAAIVELYDALLALTGSVVVAINRAVALANRQDGPPGAAEGLKALDALTDAGLAGYQPYWAARAALLVRIGNSQAAADAYRRAIGLESHRAVRRFLQAELSRAAGGTESAAGGVSGILHASPGAPDTAAGKLAGTGKIVFELKTKRLTVKPFTLDDAAFILRLLNDPDFIENIADKGVRDLEGARSYLRDGPMASYERYGFGLWRVSLASDDTPIGMAGLLRRDYLDDIDIGYALLPEFRGSGYAFEVTAAVMAYAKERLKARRVLAIVREDNEKSIRVLGKLGFQGRGTIRIADAGEDAQLFANE